MRSNRVNYLLHFAIPGMVIFTAAVQAASVGSAEAFVAKLKHHYQSTLPIEAYSLNYHFLNQQYRDDNYWDYQTPNKFMSVRMVEVDTVRKHFYDNDILYFAGGFLYDRVQFQNDKESIFYEKSGMMLGRGTINRGMENFDRFNSHNIMNVDFLAVRPLLTEVDIEGNIALGEGGPSGTTTLTHKTSDGNTVDYTFSTRPLQLASINHRSLHGIFIYSDYQTTRGITYARTVHKYYDGAKKPNYISFNDRFDVIAQVDPAKLTVPPSYGPELPKSDGVLVSKEIAANLYLVTDSSARRNSLFKIKDNEISVFGASGNSRLAKDTIELIANQFPTHKITSVYVTHPHGHQIAGLKEFVDLNVEILADHYSIAAIKASPRFSNAISKFKFRAIEHEQVIDGVHFYVLENMHSKRQGFVHFEDSGIIFQSDFLHIPFDNTIAKVVPSYSKAFIEFVRGKQLAISRIVANYRNNNISVDVMNRTYDVKE